MRSLLTSVVINVVVKTGSRPQSFYQALGTGASPHSTLYGPTREMPLDILRTIGRFVDLMGLNLRNSRHTIRGFCDRYIVGLMSRVSHAPFFVPECLHITPSGTCVAKVIDACSARSRGPRTYLAPV